MLASEAKGRGFDSRRARHLHKATSRKHKKFIDAFAGTWPVKQENFILDPSGSVGFNPLDHPHFARRLNAESEALDYLV